MLIDEYLNKIAEYLSPDGVISKKLRAFEPRQQQLDYACAVARSFYEKKHAIIEAGTGVGKSFGYLIPAILYSVEESKASDKIKPIIISTHTKNLQEQLANIDIPFLESEVFDFEFSSVVIKGRNNYMCKRRLYKALLSSNNLFKDESQEILAELAAWAEITETGDLEEFDGFIPQVVKDAVQSDKDACFGKRCTHSKSCFYHTVRKKMHKANIIIVNHALLFSDLRQRIANNGFLPEYKNLIFDEAHTLEKIATEYFGGEARETYLEYQLGKLLNKRATKGLAYDWNIHNQISHLVANVRKQADIYFDNWREFVYTNAQNNQSNKNQYSEQQKPKFQRATSILERSKTLEGEFPFEDKLSEEIETLAETLRNLAEAASDEEQHIEISAFAVKLMEFAQFLDFIKKPSENIIRWLELDSSEKRKDKINLFAAPILVNQLLQDYVFSRLDSMIMTSATLSTGIINAPFHFFKDRVGLDIEPSNQENSDKSGEKQNNKQKIELQLGSPFDFSKNVLLITPTDIPEPSDKRFEFALSEHIYKAVSLTKGGAFVLFTSYNLLNKMFEELAKKFQNDGMDVFLQSAGVTRSKLLADFRDSGKGVLFGTDSFWQGVDVQGEALRLVIITKLPFDVPSDPLFKARSEQIEKDGKSSFSEYSVPLAVLKFVQGFGRLIRHRQDKGLIVVLDKRILTKFYGRNFINALPKCLRANTYPSKLPFEFH